MKGRQFIKKDVLEIHLVEYTVSIHTYAIHSSY